MLAKEIIYFGQKVKFVCDKKCNKAWGINSRPMRSEEDDGYLSDKELGEAPNDPGTYEGGHGKPSMSETPAPNKWCVRECERSRLLEGDEKYSLPKFIGGIDV